MKIVILILIVTVIMLINNTIRLALFSQRFLIRSMQLVGATRGFIRKPFIVRAFFFGILAGILASGILYALLEYTKGNIEGFAALQNTEMMLLLFAGLIVIGSDSTGAILDRIENDYNGFVHESASCQSLYEQIEKITKFSNDTLISIRRNSLNISQKWDIKKRK